MNKKPTSVSDLVSIFKLLGIITAVILSVVFVYRIIQSTENKESITHEAVVEKIRLMGKLQLVQFQIKDIIEYKIERPMFLPDSKVLMMVSGEIGACVDLQKLKDTDVESDEKGVKIFLPSPEICYTKVNHEHSKIHHKRSWMLLDDDAELLDKSYKEAEKYLNRPDVQLPALVEAEKNASQILVPIFEKIAGKQVTVSFRKKAIVD